MKKITVAVTLLFAIVLTACGPAAPQLTPTPNPNGKWKSFSSTDQMDNSKSVGIRLDAENKIEAWLTKPLPTLFLRCKNGSLDIFVNVGTQTAVEYGSDYSTVTLKFGDEDPVDAKTLHSDDGEALFFRATNVADIVKRLLRTNKLIFRFRPFNANQADAVFDTMGIESASKDVLAECPQ